MAQIQLELHVCA